MTWIDWGRLAADCRSMAERLRHLEPIGVLGIARSGMVPAGMLAQMLDCHLGEVESFVRSGGTFMRPGRRGVAAGRTHTVLVVDDSTYAGQAMELAKASLSSLPFVRIPFRFGAVYATPDNHDRLDFHGAVVESPRIFAWNWLSHDILRDAMFDMDGVLCQDPVTSDLHVAKHQAELKVLPQLYIPKRPIGQVVTGRLAAQATITANWLKDKNVQTLRPVLCSPFATATERAVHGPARWKGETYRDADWAKLFVESDRDQVDQIHKVSGKPVLCIADWRLRQ